MLPAGKTETSADIHTTAPAFIACDHELLVLVLIPLVIPRAESALLFSPWPSLALHGLQCDVGI